MFAAKPGRRNLAGLVALAVEKEAAVEHGEDDMLLSFGEAAQALELGEHHVTIPDHASLRIDILATILADVAEHVKLTRAAHSRPSSSSAEPPRTADRISPRYASRVSGDTDVRVSRSQGAPLGLDTKSMMEPPIASPPN